MIISLSIHRGQRKMFQLDQSPCEAQQSSCTRRSDAGSELNGCAQVQTGIQIIMDTQPKGGAPAGGTSREEAVDRIAEDLLAKARNTLLSCILAHAVEEPAAICRCIATQRGGSASLLYDSLPLH